MDFSFWTRWPAQLCLHTKWTCALGYMLPSDGSTGICRVLTYVYTHGPSYMLFYFNAPCHFTPLLNLCSVLFWLMPFSWLHTWTLPGRHKSHTAEQNCEAGCSFKLCWSSCCWCLVQTMWSVYIYWSLAFVLPQMPLWNTQSREENTDTALNSCSSNLNRSVGNKMTV
jgi:hypothetical protein